MEVETLQKGHGQCMVKRGSIRASLRQARLLSLFASQILLKGYQTTEVSEWLEAIDLVMLT